MARSNWIRQIATRVYYAVTLQTQLWRSLLSILYVMFADTACHRHLEAVFFVNFAERRKTKAFWADRHSFGHVYKVD